MYNKSDIVTFINNGEVLTGIVIDYQLNYFEIKGLNGKEYYKIDFEIIECIGKSRINKARAEAENWELDKSKYPDYEDAKNFGKNKKSL